MGNKKYPWEEEQSVSLAQARNLIETQFPKLAPIHIKLIGNGWDNNVYCINHCYTFRFPRRKIAVELLDLEKNLLPSIVSFLPVKIPTPYFHGKPCKDFPWPFLGYSFLSGKTACRAKLTKDERIALATPIADFLKALHNIPTKTLPFLAPQDTLGRLNLEIRRPKLIDNLKKLQQKNMIKNIAILIKTVKKIESMDCKKNVLLHGDFYARHLLVNDKKLVGIIDWGDIHQGNPATDLEMAYCFLPQEGREIFFKEYGIISKEVRNLAIFRAIYRAELLVHYGKNIEDIDLMEEGLISFQHILQELS